jgi:hypothetical protein
MSPTPRRGLFLHRRHGAALAIRGAYTTHRWSIWVVHLLDGTVLRFAFGEVRAIRFVDWPDTECGFRSKAITHSGRKRSPIPGFPITPPGGLLATA